MFKDSLNLFALIVPNKPGLPYGEHQTIFNSLEEAAEGLVKYVIKPIKYPLNFSSIEEQARFMKAPNGNPQLAYYGGPADTYAKNMVYWFNRLQL